MKSEYYCSHCGWAGEMPHFPVNRVCPLCERNFVKSMNPTMGEEEPGGSTPSQYALPPGAVELQDLVEYREMNFSIGNIFKAAYRLGNCSHSDRLRDINKILWFANREKERLNNKE